MRGVVDDDVGGAVVAAHGIGQRQGGGLVADVDGEHDDVAAGGSELRRRLIGGVAVEVGHDHGGAVLGEGVGVGARRSPGRRR